MKYKLSELIQNSGRRMSLTDSEREKMREVLREYTAMRPVRANVGGGSAHTSSPFVYLQRPVAYALIIALLVTSGAATSYAAESALPGDALYAVKINVNEEVRAALLVSTEAKAEWEARRAERRLEEATVLASRGALSPEVRAELALRFEGHADSAVADVEMLEVEDAARAVTVATNFEASLEAHRAILNEFTDDSRELAHTVREKARALASVRVRAEGVFAVAVPPQAEAKAMALSVTLTAPAEDSAAGTALRSEERDDSDIRRVSLAERAGTQAKAQFKETSALYERVKGVLVEETQGRIKTELKAENELIVAGDRALAADDYETAFHSYQEAHVRAQKLAVYLKAASRFDVEILPEVRPPRPERETPAREPELELEQEIRINIGI